MKAILVIDEKPKTCEECRYSIKMGNNGHWFGEYCVLQSCETDLDENGLDKYCPLKPMPTKEEIYERIYQAYGYGNDETYQRIRQEVEDIYDEMIGEQ